MEPLTVVINGEEMLVYHTVDELILLGQPSDIYNLLASSTLVTITGTKVLAAKTILVKFAQGTGSAASQVLITLSNGKIPISYSYRLLEQHAYVLDQMTVCFRNLLNQEQRETFLKYYDLVEVDQIFGASICRLAINSEKHLLHLSFQLQEDSEIATADTMIMVADN